MRLKKGDSLNCYTSTKNSISIVSACMPYVAFCFQSVIIVLTEKTVTKLKSLKIKTKILINQLL